LSTRLSHRTLALVLLAAPALLLSACGGGGAAGAGTNPVTSTVVALDPAPAPRDERSFAAAWMAHGLLAQLPYLTRMAELTGPCEGGGNTSANPVTGITTLSGCRLSYQPQLVFTGSITTSAATAPGSDPAARHIDAAQVSVFNLNDSSTVNLTISGAGVDYRAVGLDTVSWSAPAATPSIDATVGNSQQHYVFSQIAATQTQLSGAGTSFVRTVTLPAFVFSADADTWQFSGLSAIRQSASGGPDTGSFSLLRQGVPVNQGLVISLLDSGGISFSAGEDQFNGIRHWNDSDIVSALTAALR
jgi:hypothetical protein